MVSADRIVVIAARLVETIRIMRELLFTTVHFVPSTLRSYRIMCVGASPANIVCSLVV